MQLFLPLTPIDNPTTIYSTKTSFPKFVNSTNRLFIIIWASFNSSIFKHSKSYSAISYFFLWVTNFPRLWILKILLTWLFTKQRLSNIDMDCQIIIVFDNLSIVKNKFVISCLMPTSFCPQSLIMRNKLLFRSRLKLVNYSFCR